MHIRFALPLLSAMGWVGMAQIHAQNPETFDPDRKCLENSHVDSTSRFVPAGPNDGEHPAISFWTYYTFQPGGGCFPASERETAWGSTNSITDYTLSGDRRRLQWVWHGPGTPPARILSTGTRFYSPQGELDSILTLDSLGEGPLAIPRWVLEKYVRQPGIFIILRFEKQGKEKSWKPLNRDSTSYSDSSKVTFSIYPDYTLTNRCGFRGARYVCKTYRVKPDGSEAPMSPTGELQWTLIQGRVDSIYVGGLGKNYWSGPAVNVAGTPPREPPLSPKAGWIYDLNGRKGSPRSDAGVFLRGKKGLRR